VLQSLLGHNGAGKTTFMSILTGLFPPSTGDMLVNGLSIRHDMPTIRGQLGLCPQYNVLFDWLTVDEHLYFCATLRGIPVANIKASATELLETLNLTEKQFIQAGSLSGGMKRKLCVVCSLFLSVLFFFFNFTNSEKNYKQAMAFVGSPQTIVLDEPTAGMDPAARRLTWELILKNRHKHTILLSTHHMGLVSFLLLLSIYHNQLSHRRS
jgi:ABC-type multidrug transport system ATPase subunit